MKNNIGILIFGDPTRGGTIASEIKFLKNLYECNSHDSEFFVITVNPTITKRLRKEALTVYNFPHKLITVFGEEDFDKLSNISCIVTYPGHSNFFGGYLNDNIIKLYKIVSHSTNILNIPAFIRINDSEIKVRDYRLLSKQRLDAGYKAREEGKDDNAFMKDPLNVAKAENLVEYKEWDYSKIYWFANGSKEACDWVAETLYDREDEYFRMTSRENFIKNTIYVSDDIFFLVRKNYERFINRYDVESPLLAVANPELPYNNKFCYIGFFDTVNMARAKAFNILLKENSYKIPFKIFGKGTEILNKFKDKPNIEIEEGFIKGDSEEYFDFLHNHLAYVFIGKGQNESRYIGKTVYDAIVARTPVIVYKKCDSKMITFSNQEYYFENEYQLNEIFKKLQDSTVREAWIKEQAIEIFGKLPPTTFKFSNYCDKKPIIEIEEQIEVPTINKTNIKSPIKTTALF